MVTARTTAARATEQTLARVYQTMELMRQALLDLVVTVDTAATNLTVEVEFPNNYPDATAHSLLSQVKSVLAGTLTTTAAVTNWPALQVVDGTISVTNFPTSTEVSNFPSTQMDGLTNAELRAAPVPVSGTVSVSNHPAALTDFPDAAVLAQAIRIADGTDLLVAALAPASPEVLLYEWETPSLGQPRVLYRGVAAQGTATSAASWTVHRLSYEGNTDQIVVDEELRDQIWDNRGTLNWGTY